MNINRTNRDGAIAVLTFDREGSSANVFDRPTLEELDRHLSEIEAEPGLRGLVLASAKPGIFLAGADLNSLGKPADEAALTGMIDLGHRVFLRLQKLPVPSVAAIHGLCLGGGLELALACDWRIASTAKATKLGLPETQLGILPAWGGSTRLPKLIGLPQALGMILTGRQLVGAQALKIGVVDALAHPEYLIDSAMPLLKRGKRRARSAGWMDRAPLSWVVARRARRDVLAKTRGNYPAPLAALEVCRRTPAESLERGFAREKDAFLKLVRTPEAANLMRVYFLQERAKKLSVPGAAGTIPVKRTAVIGAGTMGAGIAHWLSTRGFPVRLVDVSPAAVARGMKTIEGLFSEAVKRRQMTREEATAGLDRVTPVHIETPLLDVDLVIEAVIEKLELKQEVFRSLESRIRPDAILATNTSALAIEALSSVLRHPGRMVGLHFFNPVHRMQLLEIVRGPATSPDTLAAAVAFSRSLGKLPVISRDSPGFIVNRILMPALGEAVSLFREGVAVREIDRLMLDFGMPMGPLRLCDEVGLDVALHVAKDLERRLPRPAPVGDTLERMIAKGWLGRKSGAGFYRYAGKDEVPNESLGELGGTGGLRTPESAAQLDRLVLVGVNEAARVLEEGVAGAPEDVDFAMIMGTGWAPFRGGPLRHADDLGIEEVVRRLVELHRRVGFHFEPCDYLRAMAREGRTFYPAAARSGRPLGDARVSDPAGSRAAGELQLKLS